MYMWPFRGEAVGAGEGWRGSRRGLVSNLADAQTPMLVGVGEVRARGWEGDLLLSAV